MLPARTVYHAYVRTIYVYPYTYAQTQQTSDSAVCLQCLALETECSGVTILYAVSPTIHLHLHVAQHEDAHRVGRCIRGYLIRARHVFTQPGMLFVRENAYEQKRSRRTRALQLHSMLIAALDAYAAVVFVCIRRFHKSVKKWNTISRIIWNEKEIITIEHM